MRRHLSCFFFLAFVPAAGIALAQEARSIPAALPDFDLRERAENLALSRVRNRALLDRRRSAIDSFLAAARAGSRIVPGGFGLPKLYLRGGAALSAPSARPHEEIARSFLAANPSLFPFTAAELDQFRLTVRDVTPEATFLAYQQTLNGIDVFNGQLRFTLSREGEVVQAGTGDVVPGLSLSTIPSLSADDAGRTALRAAGADRVFRAAELTIFPMDASSARLAYRVYVDAGAHHSYEVVIDAGDGTLLFRQHLNVDAAQARVWLQSPAQGARELVTFPEGWLSATAATTTGNNADAYIDANGDDRADSLNNADMANGRPNNASQLFDYPFGDGVGGLDPRNFKPAAVTNLFYFLNLAHDYYYDLGFTEAAGNFQTNNFGRGGVGNDPVLGEAEYGGFTSNATFSPTPDGSSPRMRVGIFTRNTNTLTDDLDADYDGQVILHEYGHGVSNRLVGARTSTSCLSRIQSAAMGEGWSDYFAISMYNYPVFGGYLAQNFVMGIRRQSYDRYPLTYEDIGNGTTGYEVHNDGEIWAATLWDLRQSLGQALTDRLVVNGLKSTPCRPSMTDARDAILSADQAANAGANRALIWQVFARHGLGFSAAGADGTGLSGTRYDAAYDLPADLASTKNPVITSNPLLFTGTLGAPYSYALAASNPNAGTLTYTFESGPAGMTVNPATGMVNWLAGFAAARVKIVVTDGRGGRVVHGYLLPVYSPIGTDTPVTIDGDRGTTGYGYFDVPANVPVLQVTLRGGSGDADLYVRNPDGALESSTRDGSSETLSFASPKSGRWQVEVDGYAAYAGVGMMIGLVTPASLGTNERVLGLGGALGSETLYRISIPADVAAFTVSTSAGTGDVDLYLRKDKVALCQVSTRVTSSCVYDQSSEQTGNVESISLTKPAAGDYYVDLSGYKAFSGVTLTTSVTLTTATPVPMIAAGGVTGGGGSNPPVLQISPGGFATIYGTDFAPAGTARETLPADLVNGVLPVRLAGLCVDVDGKPAYLSYVSPGQVNFQVPAVRTGISVQIRARANCGDINEVSGPSVTVAALEATPEFLYWARPADGQYPVIAVNAVTGAYVGPSGVRPDLALSPAKPGDILTIFGVSFGSTTPAFAPGAAPTASGKTTNAASVRFGTETLVPDDVLYAGVSPGTAGLYQLNIRIPQSAAPGNYAVKLALGSFETPVGYVTVQAR